MNAFSNLPPQNPYIATSSQAPSSVMAEGDTGTHPRVAAGGVLSSHHGRPLSVEWQLCFSLHCASQLGSHLPCRSGHAQYWMVGNRCNEMANSGVASHIWVKGCPWKQPCVEQSRVHRWGALLARWKLFYWESSMECWRAVNRLCWMLWESSFCCVFCMLDSPLDTLSDSHQTGGPYWWFGQQMGH